MRKEIFDFASTCDVCQKIKPDKRAKPGLLRPLPVPRRPYEFVTMDLITGLPISDGYEAILVITDKLTKHAQFIPTYNNLNRFGFAKLFTENVICRFGLPELIVSDRDSRWISDFWQAVVKYMGSHMAYSSARHPQTDGQTERLNQTLEVALRAYTAGNKDTWAKWLPLLAHAYNSTPHDSTGYSPPFLLMGFEPRGPVDMVSGVGPAVGRPENIHQEAKRWLEELRAQNKAARTVISDDQPTRPSEEGIRFLLEMESHRGTARDALILASARQAKAYNKRRRADDLREGDEVLINPHSLQLVESQGPGAKLVQHYEGPFRIREKISDNVYKLHLPRQYLCRP
jgi:hypothetical protein